MKKQFRFKAMLAGTVAAIIAATALGAEGPIPRGVAHLDHVFLIMMENHAYVQVLGNPNMPFFNRFANSANLAQLVLTFTTKTPGKYENCATT